MATIVTKEMCAAFNAVREKNQGKTFSPSEIVGIFKELKFPGARNLLVSMVIGATPPIVHINRGKYAFAEKPVFIERLKIAFKAYDFRMKKARDKYRAKTPEKKSKPIADAIQNAIELLKANGYRVLKSSIQWDDV